jgi:hypothetical protein
MVNWLNVQRIKGVVGRTPALLPLLHFAWAEIVRRVDVAGHPFSCLEAFEGSAVGLVFGLLHEPGAMGDALAAADCFRSW